MDTDQSKGITEPQAQPVEEVQPQSVPDSNQTQAPVESQDVQPEEDASLPEGVKERTREQFEKLKSQIRELKSQNRQDVPQYGSVYEEFRPQPIQQPPQYQQVAPQFQTPQAQQFVDAEGNFDVVAFQTFTAQQAVAIARREAEDRIARLEESQEVKEAHGMHPEIDPTNRDKFNRELYEMVKDRLLRNKYEGKRQTLAEVTGEFKKLLNRTAPVEAQSSAQAVKEYKQAQEARNQGPIEQGKGVSRTSDSDLNDLRSRTRQGDDKALSERLKKLGI